MPVSKRIGLLPPCSFIADRKIPGILTICLVITPLALFVIGYVFEGRILPITPDRQSPAFIPGDIFLAIGAFQGLVLARKLPDGQFWYNRVTTQVLLAFAVFTTATILFCLEIQAGQTGSELAFPVDAILSPTKIYHDFVVVGVFGYIVASTYLAIIYNVIVGNISKSELAKAIWPLILWIVLLFTENLWPYEFRIARVGSNGCHITNWQPIWQKITRLF